MIRSGIHVKQSKITAAVGTGCLVSVTGILLFSIGISLLVSMEKITEASVGYGILLALICTSYFGGYTACRIMKNQRLITALLTGATVLCILLCLNILFFDGQFRGVGQTTLVIICGNILSAMWTSRLSPAGKTVKHRFPNR